MGIRDNFKDLPGCVVSIALKYMFAPPFQRIQDVWPEKRRIVIRTQVTFIFEGQAPKTRPLPIKTRVIWVLYVNTYIYIYIFKYARVD